MMYLISNCLSMNVNVCNVMYVNISMNMMTQKWSILVFNMAPRLAPRLDEKMELNYVSYDSICVVAIHSTIKYRSFCASKNPSASCVFKCLTIKEECQEEKNGWDWIMRGLTICQQALGCRICSCSIFFGFLST